MIITNRDKCFEENEEMKINSTDKGRGFFRRRVMRKDLIGEVSLEPRPESWKQPCQIQVEKYFR